MWSHSYFAISMVVRLRNIQLEGRDIGTATGEARNTPQRGLFAVFVNSKRENSYLEFLGFSNCILASISDNIFETSNQTVDGQTDPSVVLDKLCWWLALAFPPCSLLKILLTVFVVTIPIVTSGLSQGHWIPGTKELGEKV